MFDAGRTQQTGIAAALQMAEVTYHSIVRSVRKTHNNALWAIGQNILQAVIFVAAFYGLFVLLGIQAAAIRGDFLLYIMTGIFLYLTHSKAMGAVVAAEGPASPMMQHAPMNTIVSILAAAFSTLYIQVLSLVVILFAYHMAYQAVEITDPVGAFGMLLLAWFTGVALGLVMMALKPWYPSFVTIFTSIYQRANMIASGKMFVANTMPGYLLIWFDWNPLFHTIDQARGYTFINYNPRYSSWEYALIFGLIFLMIGLMAEFYTRRHASASWEARR